MINIKILWTIATFISVTKANLNETRRPMSEHRIVGGFQTSILTFPYQVSVQYGGEHLCGGTIIGSRWILTAAHCTYRRNLQNFEVVVATSNNKIGGIGVSVSQIIEHEKFNRFTIDHDYALLRLKYTLPSTNKKIKAVKLPNQDDELADGTQCLVSGWGDTRNEAESKVILRAAIIPYVSREKCNEAYSIFGGITVQMICAGYLNNGGKDSCQGDSGGPLVCNSILYGIVSWGFDCAKPNFPGVYSNVPAIRTWIKTKTGV